MIHKIYLDDMRPAPNGWTLVKTVREAITFLNSCNIKEISLDHDLGTKQTGYDVLKWIEWAVALKQFKPPIIHIHTANISARTRMILAVNKIYELAKTSSS